MKKSGENEECGVKEGRGGREWEREEAVFAKSRKQ